MPLFIQLGILLLSICGWSLLHFSIWRGSIVNDLIRVWTLIISINIDTWSLLMNNLIILLFIIWFIFIRILHNRQMLTKFSTMWLWGQTTDWLRYVWFRNGHGFGIEKGSLFIILLYQICLTLRYLKFIAGCFSWLYYLNLIHVLEGAIFVL